MIEAVTVFTRGGAVLFQHPPPADSADTSSDRLAPALHFIREILLQDRAGDGTGSYKHLTLKWRFQNKLNLVFVAVYLNLSSWFSIDDFLDEIVSSFCDSFGESLKAIGGSVLPLVPIAKFRAFELKYKDVESRFLALRKEKAAPKAPRRFDETKKGKSKSSIGTKKDKPKSRDDDEDAKDTKSEGSTGEDEDAGTAGDDDEKSPGINLEKLAKLKAAKSKKGKGMKLKDSGEKVSEGPKKPKEKSARDWGVLGESKRAVSKDLDRSGADGEEDFEEVEIVKAPSEDEEEDVELEEEVESKVSKSKLDKDDSKGSGILSYLSSFVTGKELTSSDLEKVVEGFKERLLAKNVASTIATKVTDSVMESLVGKKLATFSSAKSLVKAAMEDALTRILTPKRHIDVLREISVAKSEGRPYTIVFVGVNGVGKSTTLSKVAYYLLARDLKVSIAACDTFRAGAVEQLKTHSKRLGIEVFQQGYNKDASAVAAAGIREAKKRGDDVVLIDTAGRMQDNVPLMRALSKLINTNKPDLVLFVGEALVGNDAVDQLVKFNRALSDFYGSSTDDASKGRGIDGIVLTKFDTIDDKVGAAISMTYAQGQPIVFVGVGQDYSDIRRLSVKMLVSKLLK